MTLLYLARTDRGLRVVTLNKKMQENNKRMQRNMEIIEEYLQNSVKSDKDITEFATAYTKKDELIGLWNACNEEQGKIK
jgi:hypothetical protein